MHPFFNTNFQLRVRTALAAAEQAGALTHRGLVGQLRELVVRELLRPIAPDYIGFGTGKIVDHLGGESLQIDLIIYDKRMMPPLLFALDEPVGLYPIEACLYAIEIKSKATARAVRHAIDVGESVGALTYVPEHCHNGDPLSHVFTLLFSFDSTMKSPEREHERWQKLQLDRPRTRVTVLDPAGNWIVHHVPPLFAACVAGRGYGYYDALRGEGSFGWLSEMPYPNFEVLSCMAGVSNTLLGAVQRPGLPFGRYFLGP